MQNPNVEMMKPLTRFLSFASVSDGSAGHGTDDDCEKDVKMNLNMDMDVESRSDRRARARVLRARVDRARSSEEQRSNKKVQASTASPVRCAPSGSMGNLSEVTERTRSIILRFLLLSSFFL